jgi:hypothetical protein
MDNYYKVLLNPSKENLSRQYIICFDKVIAKYPEHEKIISYINECYNYKSPFIIEEKDWGQFLNERFEANGLPELLKADIIDMQCVEVAIAIDAYLTLQKQNSFQTLVAKQNLRQQMLAQIQTSTNTISDKKSANELITELDEEINSIFEEMKQDQRIFGNHKGWDAVQKAKSVTQLNITNV